MFLDVDKQQNDIFAKSNIAKVGLHPIEVMQEPAITPRKQNLRATAL